MLVILERRVLGWQSKDGLLLNADASPQRTIIAERQHLSHLPSPHLSVHRPPQDPKVGAHAKPALGR